jgi:hypothetical protein
MTLIPCGHVYCLECLNLIQEEQGEDYVCNSCNHNVESSFKNEQLEGLQSLFKAKQNQTMSFMEWIKSLKANMTELQTLS